MRDPRAVDLHADPAALAAIATAVAPAVAPRADELAPAAGGRTVIHDEVATVNVDRDGTTHIVDAPAVVIHRALPTAHQIGDALDEWRRDPRAYAMKRGCGETMCDDDAAPSHDGPSGGRVGQIIVPLVSGTVDATDYLMRKLHAGDPYAARKLALLDKTRDARAERRAHFEADQEARSAELMQQNLEALWARTTERSARRDALFALWDECAEDEAGLRARAQVIGWIGAKLPLTAAEVAAFDARRTSTQHFSPQPR